MAEFVTLIVLTLLMFFLCSGFAEEGSRLEGDKDAGQLQDGVLTIQPIILQRDQLYMVVFFGTL